MQANRPHEPSYGGIPTFSKLPLVLDPSDLAGVDVAIVGAPIDETVSNRPGSRYGPRAIRAADDSAGVPPSRPHMFSVDLACHSNRGCPSVAAAADAA